MKCHYEILGVPIDVDDDELKKSYRKLALKWHPDKNLTNQDLAKEKFQLIQQAYDVLSDPQERSWYDRHRDAILKGGLGDNYQDNSLDVFPYFTTTCFKGYSDDPQGFYSVFREVFNKLTTEDLEFVDDPEMKIPDFGFSGSDYESVVHPFYAFWSSYSTKKTYSWLDPYDIRDTPNRRVLRLVEKENKKIREKAKKERNEEIRNLVAFVRKRDRRVQAWSKILEEKATENAKKAEERRQKALKEKQESLKSFKEEEWSKFSNIESELKVIEANLAKEFDDHSDQYESSDSDDFDDQAEQEPIVDENMFYCPACNKVFKTDKSFNNHEKSKRHKDSVELLKASLLDEEESENSDEDDESIEEDDESIKGEDDGSGTGTEEDQNAESDRSENDPENASSDCDRPTDENEKDESGAEQNKDLLEDENNISSDNESLGNIGILISKKQRKKDKYKKQKPRSISEDSDHEEVTEVSTPEEPSQVLDDVPVTAKKLKGKKAKDARKQMKATTVTMTGVGNTTDLDAIKSELLETKVVPDETQTEPLKVNGIQRNAEEKAVRRGGKSKKDRGAASSVDVEDLSHCCVSCKLEFPSKNKLFDHLKRTGHSVFIPELAGKAGSSDEKPKKRRARKNRP